MRRLLAVLVVLAVLLVAADRIAAALAAGKVAAEIQRTVGLRSKPHVRLGGFPFLTQAFRGRYDDVQVMADDVRTQDIRVASIDAQLHGVRLPLAKALAGSVESVPARTASSTALLRYADLSAALPDRRLTLAADHGRLRLRGSVEFLSQTYAASALGTPRIQGDRVSVAPREIQIEAGPAGVATLPGTVAGLTFSQRIVLPFGLRLRSVQVRPEGLQVTARGSDVVLGPMTRQ